MNHGIVYLVGAGPGDPGLLTLRAKRLLERADVIVYDRLVASSLLCFAKPGAEIISAGKEASLHTISQDDINRLLGEKAVQGKAVVRLKGGDPFLFGRGGEEALYLARKGIAFEIVPGVTSAFAAPAYAGIPVTHRDMASSVAVVTGHEKPGKAQSSICWKELARAVDTLVIVMAVENLAAVAEKLLENGKSPETPCAIVRCGTTADQQVVSGKLCSIAQAAADTAVTPPAVLVVGAVAALREQLAWVEKRPLWGKKILVTRPLPQARLFAEKLADLGAEPVVFPTIEIVREPDLRPLYKAFAEITSYDWIAFTSVNAVDIFFTELAGRRVDIRNLRGIRFAAIGPETRTAVEARGCLVDVMPEKFSSEDLLAALRQSVLPGQRVLLPRSRDSQPVLPEGLKQYGVLVHDVVMYHAEQPKRSDASTIDAILNGSIDVLTFTSPMTVRNFVAMIGKGALERMAPTPTTAVIGPVTASAARECGLPVAIEARNYTTDGLLEVLVKC